MKTYFFDLDGTLTDSAPGLLDCFGTALDFLGIRGVDEASLRRHLGEPLPMIFRSYQPDLPDEAVAQGIDVFRRRYDAEGIFVNQLYPDIESMLQRLNDLDLPAWVVTSKPGHHAEKVCEILGIRQHFRGVVGAGPDETDTKTTLVRDALARSGAQPDSTLFLGDRHYDVTGAIENGVTPVGALWGYGTKPEMESAGCKAFAETPLAFLAHFVENRPTNHLAGVTQAAGP